MYWQGDPATGVPARCAETVFIVAVLVWAVFEAVMRVIQRLRTTEPSDDHSYFLLLPCIAGSIIAAEVLGRRGRLLWHVMTCAPCWPSPCWAAWACTCASAPRSGN
jgi:hypothetical protein